jgi:hypothetical protein
MSSGAGDPPDAGIGGNDIIGEEAGITSAPSGGGLISGNAALGMLGNGGSSEASCLAGSDGTG